MADSLKLVGRESAKYKYNLDLMGIQGIWEKCATESVDNYIFFLSKQ
jgi:hypothetical protein